MTGIPNKITDLGQQEKNEVSSGSGVKHSAFFITISTNVQPTSQEQADELSSALNEAGHALFSNEGLEQVVDFVDEYKGDVFDESTIMGIDTKFATELGKDARGKRVHLHALVKIDHISKIRLDRDMIQAFVLDFLLDKGIKYVKNVYVNIQAANTEANILDYILKDHR